MKAKLIAKIFFLFFCLLGFNSVISAQEKPRAILFYKFDVDKYEYDTDKIENSKLLTQKLDEFIERLSKEPETTRGFINIAGNSKLAEKIKSFVSENSDLTNRIIFNWNLKHPEFPITHFDFYLIPQGAKIPYVIVDELCECPTISIDTTTEIIKQNSVMTFTAKVKGGEDTDKITYVWKISAGKIIEGQGTTTIKVGAEAAKEVTATVEIGGLCDRCPREASFTTKIQ